MSDCVFCSIASGSTEKELTIYENEHVFVQISLHQKPRNRGHVLVIPKIHVTNLLESPSTLDAHIFGALRISSRAIKKAFSADGIQVRQNNGRAAGQDVFHLHFHVIPRFHGDSFDKTEYELVPLGERLMLADKIKSCFANDVT